MSSDYHYQVVVGFDGKYPLDECGHHLDPADMYLIKPQKANRKHPNKSFWTKNKTAKEVAEYNICHKEKLNGMKKFFFARELTNPYGILEFAVGNGDDFYCYDYAMLDDGRVILHATVNSETGGFIDVAGYEVVPLDEAANVALNMIEGGLNWISEGGGNPIRHSKSGWNQDPFYFYRRVFWQCDQNPNKPNFSDRQFMFGGKTINKYCGLEFLNPKATADKE